MLPQTASSWTCCRRPRRTLARPCAGLGRERPPPRGRRCASPSRALDRSAARSCRAAACCWSRRSARCHWSRSAPSGPAGCGPSRTRTRASTCCSRGSPRKARASVAPSRSSARWRRWAARWAATPGATRSACAPSCSRATWRKDWTSSSRRSPSRPSATRRSRESGPCSSTSCTRARTTPPASRSCSLRKRCTGAIPTGWTRWAAPRRSRR